MATLEIRGGGALFLDGEEIGQVTFSKPWVEGDLIGEWYDGQEFFTWFDEGSIEAVNLAGGGDDGA